MGLNKGHTNNPNGRPNGAKSKVTAGLRKRINDFLNDNWDNLEYDFAQLEPKERVNFYEKLLQYGLPRMQSISTPDIKQVHKIEFVNVSKQFPDEI